MLQRDSSYDSRGEPFEPPPDLSARFHQTIDLREIAQILRRRRWIVAGTTLLVMVAAIVFVVAVTRLYTATSTILIDPHRSRVADSNLDRPQTSSSATDDAVVDSQVLLVQSVAVLQRVVETLDLTHDPEFGPHPSILDPIKHLFGSSNDSSGQSAEDVAKTQTIDFLSRRLKAARDGMTPWSPAWIDSTPSAMSPRGKYATG